MGHPNDLSTLLYSEITDSRAEIIFLQQTEYWKLLNSSHTLNIYYFTLQIDRIIPVCCQGLTGTSKGLLVSFIVTWLQSDMGYNFLPDLSPDSIGSVLP